MERYTLQQRIDIIEMQYKNGENFAKTVCKTWTLFGHCQALCRIAIKKLVQKFELLGQVSDVNNVNNAAVSESIEAKSGFSIPRRSLESYTPQTSLNRILHKDLAHRVYEVELT